MIMVENFCKIDGGFYIEEWFFMLCEVEYWFFLLVGDRRLGLGFG